MVGTDGSRGGGRIGAKDWEGLGRERARSKKTTNRRERSGPGIRTQG